MPSGSKKRKAAKKKKENQQSDIPSPSSAPSHTHGGDDVKYQDDKESDVGEVSSPASHDHHSQHNLLTEEEKEEIEERENVSDLSSAEEVKFDVVKEHIIVVQGAAVPVEWEFKIEDESDRKNGRFEHDEPARKSYDGDSSGSSSSSSSSSDDEFHGIKSSLTAVDIAPASDSVKVADTFTGEHVEVIESTIIEQASDLIVENVPAVFSEKISSLGEKADLNVSYPTNDSGAPITENVLKENMEKKQSSIEDQVCISEVFKDATPKREEAIFPSVDNIAQETDDPLNPSYNTPVAIAYNEDAENNSGGAEPLVVPVPHPVQTTSWKSCCGLFEFFTGPGR